MCLILVSFRQRADYPLIIAANRDEFFLRPSAPAGFWGDAPQVFGGRDLEAGGSWLAITRQGRFAAVTNFRGDGAPPANVQSRGKLISDFVQGTASPGEYLLTLANAAHKYNGFNLLVGTPSELHYFSNRSPDNQSPRELQPGLYGLSNHLLDTPWPKVVSGKQRLDEQIGQPTIELSKLIDLLGDRTLAPMVDLPDTGVGETLERRLSPAFLTGAQYGTRCSTAITIDANASIRFREHTFDQNGATITRTDEEFELNVVAA
jgi:uncharacterized protein with NRDE domain